MKDSFLDEIINEGKIVQVILKADVVDSDGLPLASVYEGSLISYSSLGIGMILLDSSKLWISLNELDSIVEKDRI